MATETSLSEDEKSIRLFKSDFLEFFTHISPIIVLVVFLPLIGYLVWRAAQQNPDTWWNVLISFLIGLAIWPLAEYLLHRFLFHWQPKNPSLGTQRFRLLRNHRLGLSLLGNLSLAPRWRHSRERDLHVRPGLRQRNLH